MGLGKWDDAGEYKLYDSANVGTAGRKAVVLMGGVARRCSRRHPRRLGQLRRCGSGCATVRDDDANENFACVLVTEAGATVHTSGSRLPEGADVYVAVWAPGTDPDGPPTLQSEESGDTDEVTWTTAWSPEPSQWCTLPLVKSFAMPISALK